MMFDNLVKDYQTALCVLNKDFANDPACYFTGLYYYSLQRKKKITPAQCYEVLNKIENFKELL